MYFIRLLFLFRKIFTFYINDVLLFKISRAKGLMPFGWMSCITITPIPVFLTEIFFITVFSNDAHFFKNTSVKLSTGIQRWRWTPWAYDRGHGLDDHAILVRFPTEYETFRHIREITKIGYYLRQFSPSVRPHGTPQFPLKRIFIAYYVYCYKSVQINNIFITFDISGVFEN